jgi:signal transduction histidine kinase
MLGMETQEQRPVVGSVAYWKSLTANDVSELLRKAWHLQDTEQWDEMLRLAAEARAISERIGFTLGRPRALAVEAFVYYIRSDFKTSLSLCTEALRLASGDAEAEGRTRAVLALVHWSLGNYPEALRSSDEAIRLLGRPGDEISKAFAYAVKGGIQLAVGELDQALASHQRSIEVLQSAPDEVVGRARALSGLGLTYLAQKRDEEALAALLEALALARRVNNRAATARALHDVGEAFEALGNDEQAQTFHEEALQIRQQEGYESAEALSLLALGRIAARRAQHAEAIELLERSVKISEHLGLKPRVAQSHHALADVYQQTGQLAPALQHVLAWEKAKSELAIDEASLRYRALELETQLETVQRDAELEALASLGSLVGVIVHELNSPLGAIQSSANVATLAAVKLLAEYDLNLVHLLKSNAEVISAATGRISELVVRLKVFAGVDQARYGKTDIVSAVQDSIAMLRPEFADRVEVTVEHDCVANIYAYATELHQLFLNLLRNAVQAIEGAGAVSISITCNTEWFCVAFRDNGRGIPADALPQLFTPAFSTGSGRVRASLSLFTCMAIAKKHRGDIQVETKPGEGSTFTVRLPRSLEKPDTELEAAS